jgi:hypothetical protein
MSARTLAVVVSVALLTQAPTGAGAASPGQAPTPSGTAAVAPGWGPTATLAPNPSDIALVVDGEGTVTAAWRTSTWPGNIVTRRHLSGHAWGKAQRVGSGSTPQLAVDARGTVTLVWRNERDGFTDGVMAARHPAGNGSWSEPVRISRDVKVAGYPRDSDDIYGADVIDLAVGPKAGVVVTWDWGSDNRDKPWRIQSASLPPGGPWQPPVAVTPANGATWPHVAVDRRGRVLVAYGVARPSYPQPVQVRERSARGTWSAPTTVAHGDDNRTQLEMNRAGDAVVVVSPESGKALSVFRPHGKAWQDAERLAPAGVQVDSYSVGITGRGTALAALSLEAGGVAVVRRPADGAWSPPRELDSDFAYLVLLATNKGGDTLVCWGSMELHASYHPGGGTWTQPVTISPFLDALQSVDVAVDPEGVGSALWDQESANLKARLMRS